jgi:hypothetical protein
MHIDPWTTDNLHELSTNPELTLSALLQHTIELTTGLLLIAHPEISEGGLPPWTPASPAATLARLLVRQLGAICEILPEYRRTQAFQMSPANRPPPRNDPF